MLFRIIRRFLFSRTITKKHCKELMCYIKRAEDTSYKEQIIQYDKVYHHTLKRLGYEWSFWEILKRNPREIKNLELVWELHKLRNKLVHELGNWDQKMLEKNALRYKKVSEQFVKQVTG